MRVNIDSQVVTDARFKKLARALGVNWYEALGRCIPVWLDSYQRRCELLSEEDVDITADRDGFARALVGAGLASDEPGGVRLHGVRDRILFLVEQQERSQKGLKARWGSPLATTGAKAQAVASDITDHRVSYQDCNAENIVLPNGIPSGMANGIPNGMPNGLPNSPDLDQAPDQDPEDQRESARDPAKPGRPRRSVPATASPQLSLIPSGWEPEMSPENVGLENQKAANGARVSLELEQFRDHHRSKGTRSADWNAEWRKWLRRHRSAVGTPPPKASGSAPERPKFTPAPIVARSPAEIAELSRLAQGVVASLSVQPSDSRGQVLHMDHERAYEDDDA